MCFIDSASLSSLAEGVSRRRFLGAGLVAGLTAAAMDWGTSLVLPGVAEGAETPGASGGPGSAGVSLDRKSTRLNSSHSQNSYAVFCLKKKKRKIITDQAL